MKKLSREFYEKDTLTVAKNLLGKILVHQINRKTLMGKIVEVEAYIGEIDKACHCYNNRRTKRTEVMFGPPGYAYVYLIYGMYYCMNVVTEKEGKGSAVLIRSVEPIKGIEEMALNRFGQAFDTLPKKKCIQLTNGPGKLCQALEITKKNDRQDLLGNELFICENENEAPFQVACSKRKNIDYAQEARDFEWRFFIKDNPYVSK